MKQILDQIGLKMRLQVEIQCDRIVLSLLHPDLDGTLIAENHAPELGFALARVLFPGETDELVPGCCKCRRLRGQCQQQSELS